MSRFTTVTLEGSSCRRRVLFGLAMVVLSAAALRQAAADTYLSTWKNTTSCNFDVKGNADNVATVPALKTYDFGTSPRKDPKDVVVVPSAPGCNVPLKEARISFAGAFAGMKCGTRGYGPYKLTIESTRVGRDGKPIKRTHVFCYCMISPPLALLEPVIEDTTVSFIAGPTTRLCPAAGP